MDRGPVIFTSDVSLPKDDKSASEENKSQLGNGQDYEGTAMLTMLQRKEGLKSNGQYAKVSRPKSICIYYESPTLRYLSRTLVLSCESHPKCKLKATDNCIKRTLRKVNNPCTRRY